MNEHHLILTISVKADGIFCEYCSHDGPREQKVVSDTFMVNWWYRLNSRAEVVVQAMQMVDQTTANNVL